MFCPACREAGVQSCVRENGRWTTLLGWSSYYDEAGHYHSHDPNQYTTRYRCDQGHEWTETRKKKCWCQEE